MTTQERDADFEQLDELSEDEVSEKVEASPAEGAAPVDPVVAEIAALKAEVAEQKDKYLRALADFENYKKRAMKERSELLKYQGDRILVDILEVADNLERAISGAEKDPNSLKEGLPLIHKLLMDTLAKWEVKVESGLGKIFDPNKFRALSRVALDDTPPNTIVTEMRKTYFYKDKLLRAGEVVVSAPKEAPPAEKKEE